MKSMIMEIKQRDIRIQRNPNSSSQYKFLWSMNIPILPAFSVEYFSVQVGGSIGVSGAEDTIKGDNLIVASMYDLEAVLEYDISVILHFHGIRDYSLLFPWIDNTELRNRVGKFYEEAEKNFEQGAWLSFALMCGAVFEGMLYAKLNMPQNNTFFDMITEAYKKSRIINLQQKEIMNDVRHARNLIHSNKFNLDYITRKKAMDIMSTMNKLIKQFAY
ncbi:DUF4145 domain-containing protein [Priestia filamentosa]|uniref:DUF4145 domain-containing protein n=1 Tax=Priestia filamentosa TaxID=1402861 RepID=UPI003981FA54